MKIVSVASEMVPFAKTGGLADVAGTLPNELKALGHEVIAFLPHYRTIDAQRWQITLVIPRLEIPMGHGKEIARVFKTKLESGVEVYFIDHPEYFFRDGFYGTAHGDYPDNDRRFTFFQRAVLETLKSIKFSPEIIHCHDWQTGLIPVFIKALYSTDTNFKKTRTVFTVHNLAYQGNFPPDSLPMTGLGWEHFKLERVEFYGKMSFLKGGLVDADAVTTVSERYAKEIQSKEFGCGMEGVLANRRDKLYGIVNGIDNQEWNPEKDQELIANFNIADIQKKNLNKEALQKENGFAVDPKIPLIGFVSRLVDQKGLDILVPAIESFLALGSQFVLLGTGEERYHHVLRDLAKKNKGKFKAHILFDAKVAKHIYAGSDMMLMPSYFEPCGLGQMIALRFGTIPVVRATGGLADTVLPFNAKTKEGNGFSFDDYSSVALVSAIRQAIETYRDAGLWGKLVANAMASDFSWTASAKQYIKLFEQTKRRPLEGLSK